MQSSVVSYPERGSHGSMRYRGNTTGKIIVDFLKRNHRNGLFCDPAEGSGTSRDVAKELNIEYKGLDLKQGFDILEHDLLYHLSGPANTIFFHPPYAGMIKYSGSVWGDKPHEHDLSHATSIDDFLEKMHLALLNIFDALSPQGTYGLLIGNWRQQGMYYNLGSLVEQFAPGKLKDEIIKIQHNVTSNSTMYSGSFIPIMHEKLLVFVKDKINFSLGYAINLHQKLKKINDYSWKNIVKRVFMRKGKVLSLSEIYEELEQHEKTLSNKNWKAKIRQIVQLPDFERVSEGVYEWKS